MINILVSSNISDDLMAKIQAVSDTIAIYRPADIETQPELLQQIEIFFGKTPNHYWQAAPQLKWHQSTHAGVAYLVAETAIKSHAAIITNIHTHPIPMAEQTFGMLLMMVRNLDLAYRQQLEKNWSRKHIRTDIGVLHGRTIGVMGLGAVGSQVAKLAIAFGMHVIGYKRTPANAEYPIYTPGQLAEFLPQCDIVVMALPGTTETQHIIGTKEFQMMKPTTLIANIGRGTAIDTDALVKALQDGLIGGAALDVTDPEPLPTDSPLWTLPKVIITPHSSSDSMSYLEDATQVFIENLKRYIAGQKLHHIIDRELGY